MQYSGRAHICATSPGTSRTRSLAVRRFRQDAARKTGDIIPGRSMQDSCSRKAAPFLPSRPARGAGAVLHRNECGGKLNGVTGLRPPPRRARRTLRMAAFALPLPLARPPTRPPPQAGEELSSGNRHRFRSTIIGSGFQAANSRLRKFRTSMPAPPRAGECGRARWRRLRRGCACLRRRSRNWRSLPGCG